MLTHVQSVLDTLKASDKDSFVNAVVGYYSDMFSRTCTRCAQYYKIKGAKSVVNPLYEWLQQEVFHIRRQLELCHYRAQMLELWRDL